MDRNYEPRILIDVDGVLADFMGAVLSFVNTRHGTNFNHHDMYDDFRVVIKEYHTQELENFIKSEGFCQMLKVLPGAIEGVQKLRDLGWDIMFVTSPYKDAPTWAYDRMKWLERYFGATREDVIFARNKKYVHGVTLIDDLPRNCIEWSRYNQACSYMYERPWNIKDLKNLPENVKTLMSWKLIENFFEKMK